ncbi:substrate-binding domain-containing protein [Streptomyces triticirhizae]|uniref:Sugar ABC transporter substrate-binding protein n=1 Tax=Streptomyces triticirhizae TaxID=2483353 RepID=A0A3M2LJP9_9ACTN|nr:substrate-binding domain-containing protein [Streptomyces triticirhizae]RMI37702.1 sugar ABC transporter substrate-binding protein [Streptomyces triticirhizae]
MRQQLRLVGIGVASLALTVALAACGEAGGGDDDDNNEGGGGDGGGTIGLLLPEDRTTRYESFDRPFIEDKIGELCPDCTVDYNNASEDTNLQKQQFDAMLTGGVDVIILDPVDASATATWVEEAEAEGVPVIAYDRLAEGPIQSYVSYDNRAVGELQGQALLDALGDEAEGARVVMINGSPTDPNAGDFKAGAESVLEGTAEIVFSQDIDGWDAALANEEMNAAIDSLGADGFDAVYVANDGMAAGVINALQAAGITDVPVGGQDAELAGLQRIVTGEQTFTIYKALRPEAEITAEIAVRLLNGEDFADLAPDSVDSPTNDGIPSTLLEPVPVTVDTITDTVIADEFYAPTDICTAEFADACQEAGLG